MREYNPVLTDEMKRTYIDSKKISSSEPIYVKRYSELVSKVSELAYLNKDVLLFFRGQHQDYQNKNKSSSFYPTIYRGEYLRKSEIEYRFSILYDASNSLKSKFKEAAIKGFNELSKKTFIQWSILQHYEVCDTPLIDVSHSIRVACTFAYNKNHNDNCFFYVFGLPYLTNRISNNSEHDLVIIRLLSISPPKAKRPYFQEGYLTGTTDITYDYDSKSELDVNRRLVGKFEFPNSDSFWDYGERPIDESYIYPENDYIKDLCDAIKPEVKKGFYEGDSGQFLRLWSDFENKIEKENKNQTINNYFNILKKENKIDNNLYNNLQDLRIFRNNMVHNFNKINKNEVKHYEELLRNILNEKNI